MKAKKQENTQVPQLRFPEFANAGNWRKLPLQSALSYEQPAKYIVETTNYTESGIPVLTANKSFILGYTQESQGIYEKGECIIFDDFTTDRKYVNFPFKIKSSAIKLLQTKRGFCLYFVFSLMDTIKFSPDEHKRYYISTYQLKEAYFPLLEEQIKIANCLSSLDKVIEEEKAKLKLYQKHKEALLQELFVTENENNIRLKFDNFSGNTTSNTLSELFNIRNGYTPSKNVSEYWESGNIPWFRLEDIRESGRILADSIQHITARALKGKGIFPADSIIISTSATIGEHALIKSRALSNQRFVNLSVKNSAKHQIDIEYFFYHCYRLSAWCKRNTNTGGFASVNMNRFREYIIIYPLDMEEQKKIAKLFLSLDKVINFSNTKIKKLRLHKQYLIQNLMIR